MRNSELRQREPVERGAMLFEIIKPLFAIRYSEHFEGDGAVFFGRRLCSMGLRALCPKDRRTADASGPSNYI